MQWKVHSLQHITVVYIFGTNPAGESL